MRKLNFLKTIVDYVWILSIICYPIIIVVCATMLISNNPIDFPIKINGNLIELDTIWNKIGLIISLLNFGLILYALYNFKIVLLNFKNKLIFEVENSMFLDKIGNLIIFSSSLYLITELLSSISKNNVSIQIGIGPFLYLMALGLFFKVLSEVFLIGKRIKEENELTI
ncbi:Protein of unknown function DUF2975 [Flavobacteriaceae bacterium]